MAWLRRLFNTIRPGRMQRDIDREIAFHLAERADDLRARGLTDADATRGARLRFGNPLVQAERTRDADLSVWLDALLRTLRSAGRGLVRTPGFSLTVVLTLAVGIGANTAVFSVLDTVLFRPLPFPDADRLVLVKQVLEAETNIAPVRLEDWNRRATTFAALTGYYVEDVADTTGDFPERARRAIVAPRFFEVWQVAPAIGRAFSGDELLTGGPRVVMISDRYWRTRLGGDPDVLARTVRLEGRPFAIAGVMPASFAFPDRRVDLWSPYALDGTALQDTAANRQAQWYTGVGRLAAGVTVEQAEADLVRVQTQRGQEYPDTDARVTPTVDRYRQTVIGDAGASLWVLFGAVTILLLIACTNIAALLLSRAVRREHEVALRLSLGASRAAVAGQLLTETALLAGVGAAAGLLVAVGAAGAIRALAPDLPRVDELVLDGRLLAYTTGCALVVALLCGVFPALRGTRGVALAGGGSRTQVSTRHRAQWVLVGVQLTLSVTLLAGAGLLLRSIDALARVDPGFDPARVLTLRISGNWGETVDRTRMVQRIHTTIDRLSALPGTEGAATAWALPGVPRRYQTEFTLVEGRSASEPALMAEWRTVSPEYFRTLRIPIVSGELCDRRADGSWATQVMVNRRFADRYLAGRPAHGLHLSWENNSLTGRIVGVVGDARELGLDRDPAPTVYACEAAPSPFPWFLVRTQGEALASIDTVRVALKEIEPLRSVHDVAALETHIGDAYAETRLRTLLLTLFAGTALALAALGLYGTLSYVVSLRRREVGLRLALGARRLLVVRHLVGAGLRVVGIGAVCGLLLSLAFGRFLGGMLYGVTPADPLTLAGVIVTVLIVGAVAALVPATRAALIEPMRVLREE